MAYISLAEAQQWFAGGRLDLPTVDEELEATAMEVVVSQLRARYDASTWVSPATTPDLVRKIVSLLHSAWYFNRVSNESVQTEYGKSYGDKLESLAMLLLGGLAGGSTPLPDTTPVLSTASIAFWPTDDATETEEAPRAFTMGGTY